MFKRLPRSPRAALPALVALSLAAIPAAAQAAHSHHAPRALAADAAEREARAQEREAQRTARREEREAARAERQAAREQRRASRASERASTHAEVLSASPRGCRVSIQTSAPRIVAGEAVTVFGKVTCPQSGEGASASSAAGGQQLTVEQMTRNRGASVARAFAAAGSVTTEADGSYQLPAVTLQSNTVFRVRLGRHGAHTGVHVAPLVTLNAPTPQAPAAQPSSAGGHTHLARNAKLVFTGTVSPAAPGARVALQVSYPADGEQWHTIAFGRVSEGSFSIVHGLRIPGEAKLRVLAHPKGANSPGASEAVAYTVPEPQNPQLTIQASANPIVAGQTVTISGVAASGAGQAVTLLARTKGGSYAPVATSTTEEGGAYTFAAQAPLQSTYYEVSEAATRSVALFVGVKYALTLNPPPGSLATGETLTVSGSVAPAHAGASVLLERGGPSGLGFHPIAASTVAADGTFALTHVFENATAAKLRVRVANDAQNLGSASAPFELTVSAGPAATLAPEQGAPAS